jgi:hypothetical protein
MRYSEVQNFNITEGVDFSAKKKDPKKGYWVPVTGTESQFQDVVYTTDFDRSGKDAFDYINPKYKEEHDLHLSGSSAGDVMDALGYKEDNLLPIDEFIGKTTQWLKQHIGKPSPEEPTQVDKNPGGATIYSMGKSEGYYNRVVKQMNQIARDGKAMGATHVGWN